VHQVGEHSRRLTARPPAADPFVDCEQREDAAGLVIGMAVERIGQGDQRRAHVVEHAAQFLAQIGAVVGDVRIDCEGIRRIRRARRGRARRMGAPPVTGEQRHQTAVGKSQHLEVFRRHAERVGRGPRLGDATLTVGDEVGGRGLAQTSLHDDAADVAVTGGHQHDVDGAVARDDALDQAARCEGFVVGMRGDDQQPLPFANTQRIGGLRRRLSDADHGHDCGRQHRDAQQGYATSLRRTAAPPIRSSHWNHHNHLPRRPVRTAACCPLRRSLQKLPGTASRLKREVNSRLELCRR
jgi:hypothetical protein